MTSAIDPAPSSCKPDIISSRTVSKEIYHSFEVGLERINGDASWTLAMPARYVIGQDAVIRSADIDSDYSFRTDPEETLAVLKKI